MSGAGYHLVVTNVPYLGRGKQDPILQAWAKANEPDAKADLATMFISRSFKWLAKGGSVAVVSPRNWLFLTTYRKRRERLLRDRSFRYIAALGEEAFQSFGIRGPRTTLICVNADTPSSDNPMFALNVGTNRGERIIYPDEKTVLLRGESGKAGTPPAQLRQLPQAGQRKNPDA